MSAPPAYHQAVFEVDAVARGIVARAQRPGADHGAVLAEIRATVDHFYKTVCDGLDDAGPGSTLMRQGNRAGVRLALTPTHLLGPTARLLGP